MSPWFKIKEIPPQWVGREGSERMAVFTWTRDPSWAHEYALKRQLRGARCQIIPSQVGPPWSKP